MPHFGSAAANGVEYAQGRDQLAATVDLDFDPPFRHLFDNPG